MNEETIYPMGGTKEDDGVQVAMIGALFEPGMKGNAAIAEALGYETKVEDGAAWVVSKSGGWTKAPLYCSKDSKLVKNEIEEAGIKAYVVHTGEKQYVTVVVDGQNCFLTVPLKTPAGSLACAFHHLALTGRVSHP